MRCIFEGEQTELYNKQDDTGGELEKRTKEDLIVSTLGD